MYCKHFGLDAKPFAITPDPRFLFLSDRHREALAHLLYGIGEGGGFVQLTGEVGTGKTTLCRALLEQLPEAVDVALILNPKLSAFELVAAICDELQVDYPRDTASLKVLVDHLNDYLLRMHGAGRRTILIIDEAQNLSSEVLEQIRLLTNLETTKAKLLQIVLIGQPELQVLLARNELRQLAQRITARYHLGALNRDEVQVYITHRLKVTGGHGDLFTRGAVDEVHRLSGGIPRLINIICDRALLGAYVEDKSTVDRRILQRAAREVLPEVEAVPSVSSRVWPWAATAVLVIGIGALAWYGKTRIEDLSASSVALAEDPVAEEPALPLPPESSESQLTSAADAVLDADMLPPPDPLSVDEVPHVDDFGERLLVAADESAGLHAWSSMFKLWSIELYLEDDLRPCDQAARQGLRCLIRSGNWTQLRGFDRPAVLQMLAPNGRRVSVLLKSLDDQRATVELSGENRVIPLTEIDRHWHGQFVLLWRPPVGSETLRIGSRGEDVRWLRGLLDRLQPGLVTESAAPDLFDAELAERVRAFQINQSLDADGVVGTMTLIHLNSADRHSGGPRLTTAAAETS